MHSEHLIPAADGRTAGERTSLHLLVDEATRQLNICNACRYCEGFCAVFPALERRTLLERGDISQLANLCHDCRACFDACMYTTPHEFEVNVPRALAAVRLADYQRYVWPPRVPKIFGGWLGVFAGALIAAAIVIVVAIGNVGASGLVVDADGAASPYDLIPYPTLLALLLIPAVYSVVVMTMATRRYWREVDVSGVPLGAGAVWRALRYAATLRYLRGGGGNCYYPDDEKPSASRRHLHAMVAYGFGLCFVSTVSAAILQDLLGAEPPYGWVSVPVVTGTVGGVALAVGCIGLLALKARTSSITSLAQMTIKDYGLLVALTFLSLSGLATLLTRTTSLFGIVYLIHLASIVLTFALAPYSKFVHLVYRFAALLRDNAEQEMP